MDYKTREDVPNEYKWDLAQLIKDKKEFKKICSEAIKELKTLEQYKGRILENSEGLYNFLKQEEVVNRLFLKIYVYSKMNNDTNSLDDNKQKMKLEAINLWENFEEKTAFIMPEILKSSLKKIEKLIVNNKELESYRFSFEKIFRYKNHTLSDVEESLLSKMNSIFDTSSDIHYCLDNTDINLGEIEDEDGNRIVLTNSNYVKFLENPNQQVRINAFNAMYSYFEGLKHTFATNFRNKVKENITVSKIKKYDNPLIESLYKDNITVDVYKNLIKKIHDNMDIMYDYFELKRKALKLEEMHMYDVYLNITDNYDTNISFEECKKMIFLTLKPLGDKYLSDLNKAFEERWIDVFPTKGKKSGAYSWGCYDSYPYILLNYNGTLSSVSTTAHELGHSMHSYYSKINQPFIYHDYPIFLAEIASTVNEILLTEYYLSNTTDENQKKYLLVEILDKIKSTIYRQTMFAEFEMITHDKEQNGSVLTEKEISETYYNLNKLYYGDKVVSDEKIKYEWARIPHFYSSFYVYKYATGLSCAISIAQRLLNNDETMQKLYMEFLSSGCSDYPLKILKKMGIDLESGKVIDEALKYAKEKLTQLEQIIK